MKPAAALLLAAALVLPCCSRTSPRSDPVTPLPPAPPFAAAFRASVRSEQGRLRLSGIVAADRGGRLRVEMARSGSAFLLVSGPGGTTAVLSAERLYFQGGPGAPLIGEITGMAITPVEISEILTGPRDAASARETGGCAVAAKRWRGVEGRGQVPTRIRFRCQDGQMRLRLGDLRPLEPGRASRAFAPLQPPLEFTGVDASGLARALYRSLATEKDAPAQR